MTRKAAPTTASLPAAKVHAWRLARQRLVGSPPTGGPIDVARALVGVQAQVLSSGALAIALRSKDGRVEATSQALQDRTLVRAWAMRGTLHLFDADDYQTIIAAMGGKENWRRPAWLRYFGVTEPQMAAAIESVGRVLDDGKPRTRAELADELTDHAGPEIGNLVRGSWGTFLKQAAEKGYVMHAAGGDDNGVRFVRPSRWLGSWREEEQEGALRSVILRYLATYGPASQPELRRWWGITQATVFNRLASELGDELTEVEVDGDRAFVRTEDLAAIEATKPTTNSVHLLGGFDPLIVGAGLRDQLIPAAHLKRVSRTAGWISPVVLVDGRVAGVWDARRADDRLEMTVDAFEPLPRGTRSAVIAAAERVAAAQGVTAKVAYGPVFATSTAAPQPPET